MAVCQLIKETGDFSILDLEIEWQDGGKAAVLDHVKAAVNRLLQDKGKHGLVRFILRTGMMHSMLQRMNMRNRNAFPHQFCMALKELEALLKKKGDQVYAGKIAEEYRILRNSINAYAWDGAWYMRALSDVENIGSKKQRRKQNLSERADMGCFRRCCRCREITKDIKSSGFHGA